MERGFYMSSEKITITNKLRLDIIERRKNEGISSYDLSEKVGNGHSKFWLQNIESGKTKKITKDDLLKIYMVLNDTDDPDSVVYQIEQILNQSIGSTERKWFELIDISNDFSEIYEEDNLMNSLNDLLEDQLIPEIRSAVFGMSTNQKQAALTALQQLYYSLYKNPDLAFALIGIPVYGIKDLDEKEHSCALNSLLSMYSKFKDLSEKNQSMNTIKEWQKRDEYYATLSKKQAHTALNNFKEILSELYNELHSSNPNIFPFVCKFNTDVSFVIERSQPNVLKHYLKSWDIFDGKGFVTHIRECIKWFSGFQEEYALPPIYSVIDIKKLPELYDLLNNYGNIYPSPDDL